MVRHEVDHDLEVEFVSGSKKGIKICQGAEARIDIGKIDNIVAMVTHGRRIKRTDPDRSHAKIGQVGESVDDTSQITDTIVITILETQRIDLIYNALTEP